MGEKNIKKILRFVLTNKKTYSILCLAQEKRRNAQGKRRKTK